MFLTTGLLGTAVEAEEILWVSLASAVFLCAVRCKSFFPLCLQFARIAACGSDFASKRTNGGDWRDLRNLIHTKGLAVDLMGFSIFGISIAFAGGKKLDLSERPLPVCVDEATVSLVCPTQMTVGVGSASESFAMGECPFFSARFTSRQNMEMFVHEKN
ncbi:MAG: hypothetical protein ACIALR_10125 [Blastopirellula sp. JB062]